MSVLRRLPTFLLVAALAVAFTSEGAWAAWPALRLFQGVRVDERGPGETGKIHDEVVSRAEFDLVGKQWWHVLPFGEVRRDTQSSTWSRMEVGAEFGVMPFTHLAPPFSWFYVGNGFHQAWVRPGRDHPEWEIRTLFNVPVPFIQVGSRQASFYLGNEYTYDLRLGAGIRNEGMLELRIPLPAPRWSTVLGWKHMDLIHEPDMDQIEVSLLFEI